VQKIRGLKFDTLVAPSGGVEKNLNRDAQLQTIAYKMPPKFIKILHGLIAFR